MACGLIKVAAKALLNLRVRVMTRSITPKHITNLVGAHIRGFAPEQHSLKINNL